MKKNNYGGTLIGIIIGMLILTFIALSIINIVSYNKEIVNEYQIQTDKNILKQNTNNILKKIDLSKVKEGEIFYINKNETTKIFEVFTGTTNKQYKFIDNLGNKVSDITSFDRKIYARDLRLSTDVIKKIAVTSVNPNSFSGLINHFDTKNPNGDGTLYNNGDIINTWVNKALPLNAIGVNNPTYNTDIINTYPAINFNGISAYNINTDPFQEAYLLSALSTNKNSFTIVFKTGNDINSIQNIYEIGDSSIGASVQINNGILYAGLWNTTVTKTINLGAIKSNTPYYIIIIQSPTPDNTLKGYLNGKLINTIINVPDLIYTTTTIGLGKTNISTKDIFNNTPLITNSFFKGYIGEFIGWNHSLTNTEIVDLKKYIEEKWNMGKASILDNVNISIIVKDINITVPH